MNQTVALANGAPNGLWSDDSHPAITRARLKVLAPELVYSELKAYGQRTLDGPRLLGGDEELERALFERKDPLVNLGLAEYASKADIVGSLYERAQKGTGDAMYDRGMRLACLSNRIVPFLTFRESNVAIDSDELRRLALEGDGDELICLMKNPSAGGLLRDAYGRANSFADIPIDRLNSLVRASIGNPRLNIDESNYDGPDVMCMDIRKSLFGLLQFVPVTAEWVNALHPLLMGLNPSRAMWPAVGETAALLERWAPLKIPQMFGDKNVEQEGYYSPLSLVDEFRCLVGALYGRSLGKDTAILAGKPDDADIALRCAYYGNAQLTPEQMKVANGRDEGAFVFAALFNDNVFLKRECRALLEEQLFGREQFRVYAARCTQVAEQWPSFNPKPVSDVIDQPAESKEMVALASLGVRMTALEANTASNAKMALIGFVVLFLLVAFFKH
jgi:hypothetical protein